MLGIYGLIFEFYSPGLGVGGVTGLICLLVAAYALQMLPVSYAGLALLVLGIGLIAFEALSPSFGLFGLAGLVAFVLASVMLIDSDDPAWRISLALIAALAVSTAALVIFVLGAAIRARHRPVVSGVESITGQLAMAREDFDHVGHVTLNGEIWQAETSTPVKHHQPLRVIGIKGLTLKVEPADKE